MICDGCNGRGGVLHFWRGGHGYDVCDECGGSGRSSSPAELDGPGADDCVPGPGSSLREAVSAPGPTVSILHLERFRRRNWLA